MNAAVLFLFFFFFPELNRAQWWVTIYLYTLLADDGNGRERKEKKKKLSVLGFILLDGPRKEKEKRHNGASSCCIIIVYSYTFFFNLLGKFLLCVASSRSLQSRVQKETPVLLIGRPPNNSSHSPCCLVLREPDFDNSMDMAPEPTASYYLCVCRKWKELGWALHDILLCNSPPRKGWITGTL